jgi:hypothetical protein
MSGCVGDDFRFVDYLENLHSLVSLAITNTFV